MPLVTAPGVEPELIVRAFHPMLSCPIMSAKWPDTQITKLVIFCKCLNTNMLRQFGAKNTLAGFWPDFGRI